MTRSLLFLPCVAALALAGCADGTHGKDIEGALAIFEPSTASIPVPNNLLYSGSEDLTLEIPVTDPMDFSDPQVALGRLDGWSTSAPFIVEFSSGLDASTLVAGTSLRLFEVVLDNSVTPVGGPVAGVTRELAAGEFELDLAPEDASGSTVRVAPTLPFAPATSYMLVVTDDLRDATGQSVRRDSEYELARSRNLFPVDHPFATLQLLVLAMEGAAEAAGVERESIVLTSTFTTQSIGAVLGTLAAVVQNGEAAVITTVCASGFLDCSDTTPRIAPATVTVDTFYGVTNGLVPGSPGVAEVYGGGLTVPYFLTAANNPTLDQPVSDPTPLAGFWRSRFPFLTASGPDTERNLTFANPLPEPTGTEEVPLLIAVPNDGTPKPWPVVIFQHGITSNRSTMLLVADALCGAGFAVVAIDHPLHGLSDPTNPLFTSFMDGGRRERTFGLDLLDNATLAPVPDGIVDDSGAHYLNLGNLLVGRDNLRQSASDLLQLESVLGLIDVDGGGPDLDPVQTFFVGQSLGAMVGQAFLLFSDVDTAALSSPGAGLAKLLVGSGSFGPLVTAALAAAGVSPGTPEFEAFLFAAQTLLDDGDAVNYGPLVTGAGRAIHMLEIIGGGPGGGEPDGTVPNSVPGAPLSGTEALARVMSLNAVTGDAAGNPLQGIVRFIEGEHTSFLNPLPDAAVTAEMQAQVVSFFLSGGTAVTVADETLIQTTP